MISSCPQHVDGDHDADRRQYLPEECQRAVPIRRLPEGRGAAPIAVGSQRPNPDQRKKQYDLLEKRIEGAVGEEDSRDRIADADRRQVCRRIRRKCRRRLGQQKNNGGKSRGNKRTKYRDRKANNDRECLGLGLGMPGSRGRAEQQCAGHTAADRRLRQRNIDRP